METCDERFFCVPLPNGDADVLVLSFHIQKESGSRHHRQMWSHRCVTVLRLKAGA